MKSVGPGLIILSIAFFAVACNQTGTEPTRNQPAVAASPVATATPDEFASARTNFQKHCSTCHGERAEGGIVKVENKRLKVPSLREGHPVTHPDEKLIKQITKGDEEMPAFKEKLTAQEIQDLVRFVRKEFQGK
jgi:mono/diheme cytochrome c family protein